MSVPLIVNGVGYNYPTSGDQNWAENASNWAVAVTQTIQTLSNIITPISGGVFSISDGTAATPSLRLLSYPTTGIYKAGINILGFASAGVSSGNISALGAWTLGSANSSQNNTINGTLTLTGTTLGKFISQPTTVNSDSVIYASQASTSTSGSAYFVAQVASGTKWSFGTDTASSGQFVISDTDGLTSNRVVTIQPSTGNAVFTGPVAVGTLSASPGSPINGQSYYDSSLNKVRVYQNGNWINTDRNIISVRDFGATGNGTTDDTSAIQAAIDYANSVALVNGSSVFFPAGRYLISNITIPAEMTFYGEGADMSILFGKSGSTGYMLTDEGDAAHIELHRLGFYANNQSYDSIIRLGYGTTQLGSDGTIISDIVFRDAPNGVGLDINGNVAIFRNCTGGNLDIGIRVLGNANSFDQCSVAGYTTYGIYAGDSFWTQTELEAPNLTTSIPFYFLRQVKVFGIIMSLSEVATNFTNLFYADAGASNCTIDGLILYPSASTYTNLVGGDTTAVTFTTSTAGVPTANTIPVYSQINREDPIAISSSALSISGTTLSGITAVTPTGGSLALTTGVLELQPGTAASPSYSFTGNGNMGLFNSSGILGIATNGISAATVDLSQNWSFNPTSACQFTQPATGTGFSNAAIPVVVSNANSTASNWAGFGFADSSASNAAISAAISTQFIDRTNHYGTLALGVRSSSGFLNLLQLTGNGVTIGNSSSSTLRLNVATATSATTGTNGAVPAQVALYATINVDGTNYKVPLFNT